MFLRMLIAKNLTSPPACAPRAMLRQGNASSKTQRGKATTQVRLLEGDARGGDWRGVSATLRPGSFLPSPTMMYLMGTV